MRGAHRQWIRITPEEPPMRCQSLRNQKPHFQIWSENRTRVLLIKLWEGQNNDKIQLSIEEQIMQILNKVGQNKQQRRFT